MSGRPLISIAIPTRNRAELLRHTLEALRRQSFGDFEVVVSDDHSSDHTVKVVREMNDPRFRLVQSPGRLNVSAHFDFAASHCQGEYLKFMPDRLVLLPFALEILSQVIQATGHPLIGWHSDRYDDAEDDNRMLNVHYRSGRLLEIPSRSLLAYFYNLQENSLGFPLATPSSSLVSRELAQRVRQRCGGRLMPPFIGDITYPLACLALTPSFLYLDLSLMVAFGHQHSIGHNMVQRGREAFQAIVGDEPGALQRVPCRGLFLNTNLVADDLLRMQEILPAELAGLRLNQALYFVALYRQLERLAAAGVPTARELSQVEAAYETWRRQQAPMLPEALAEFSARPLEIRLPRLEARQIPFQAPGGRLAPPWEGPVQVDLHCGGRNILEALDWAEAHLR